MILIVMGVSGVGKSTVAQELAQRLALPFIEGDDFHPPHNVRKMRSGQPLTDEDRILWLDRLATRLAQHQHQGAVLACSALKQIYRDRLTGLVTVPCHWVYLQAAPHVIAQRLQQRQGHFMPASLLESQLAILEPPTDALTIDAEQSPAQCVMQVLRHVPPLHP